MHVCIYVCMKCYKCLNIHSHALQNEQVKFDQLNSRTLQRESEHQVLSLV